VRRFRDPAISAREKIAHFERRRPIFEITSAPRIAQNSAPDRLRRPRRGRRRLCEAEQANSRSKAGRPNPHDFPINPVFDDIAADFASKIEYDALPRAGTRPSRSHALGAASALSNRPVSSAFASKRERPRWLYGLKTRVR